MKKAILLLAATLYWLSPDLIIACWSPPRPLLKDPESYIDSQVSYYSLCEYDNSTTPPRVSCKPYNKLESRFKKIIIDQFTRLKHEQAKDVSDESERASSMKYESENYATYIKGAEKFNSQNYAEALKIFAELSVGSQSFKDKSWVREASTYMIARTLMIMSEDKWDGYSDPTNKVDQLMLAKAASAYLHYLNEYPKGLYASSARNIKRKILYLAGNQQELDKELKLMMSEIVSHEPTSVARNDRSIEDIINEFRYYFKGEIDIAQDHPVLITYKLLDYKNLIKAEEIEILKNREQDFSQYPGLFKYLYTLGLYDTAQYEQLLGISEEPLSNNLLSKSTAVLRARSLAKLNRNEEALKAFTRLYILTDEDILEGEIADLKLNMGNGISLYTASSPLKREKNLRAFALRLTDDELEKGVNLKDIIGDKRQYILEELIRRYLLSRRFKELAQLFNVETHLSKFANIKPAVLKLAEDSNDPSSLVELAEFIYRHYITPKDSLVDPDPYTEGNILSDIKQSKEVFEERTKNYEPPINFFRSALKAMEQATKREEIEAKALHCMVECTHGLERYQRCTWSRERPNYVEGKKAFQRLHKYYKSSSWAAKTPYYYSQ